MNQTQLAEMAQRPDVQRRVNLLMVKAAVAILNGTPESPDILLGQRVLKGQESPLLWAYGALSNPVIAAGAHEPDGSTILDQDMENCVNALWSAFKV